MASSSLSTKSHFHVRSNSLPSRPHPLVSQVEEHLWRLRSNEASSSSVSSNINGLTDLYDTINNLLVLPHTQQALAPECNEKQVDEVLVRSLRLMDVCGSTKDAMFKIKEDTQDVQSILRRRRGDESKMANEVREYFSSRKTTIKAVRKSFRDLKSACTSSALDHESVATISMLREVEGGTLTVFLSYISGAKGQLKPWSLFSKLMLSKRIACEEEATEVNEFEKVDATLSSLVRNKSRKSSNMNAEDAQSQLGKLESCIQDLEEGLECLLRRVIKTRVSLLNILNH